MQDSIANVSSPLLPNYVLRAARSVTIMGACACAVCGITFHSAKPRGRN